MAGFRENLAENIRKRRGNLTQEAFAKRIGIDQSSVNRIEQGEQNVTIDTLELLCKRLKCKAGELLDC
ncbi:helix-turn-helix domain-containing protein [Hyphococcus luteus]|uniref:Transcriptional regulator n=1 Tax=Hyphococcus luteus TaxID=2058213 RepID=A0A2S7K3W9_9PROT|nr:transcriptional regulator [Marinicaulis flavus]